MADSAASTAAENTQKLENAIRAVNQKKPVPEIDFTLHTMEDGTQVSTLERVCKGTACAPLSLALGRVATVETGGDL